MAHGKKDSLLVGGSGGALVEEVASAMEMEKTPVMEEDAPAMEVEEARVMEEEALMIEEDEGKDEEEEEEEDGEQGVQEEAEEPREDLVVGQGSPPKLAEGFYEIEAIRHHRCRQGQLQYLVKWCGWPDSANTWEPYENLQACSVLVDAFDKRWQPRSHGKRKCRILTTIVTCSKPSNFKRRRPRRSDPELLPYTPAQDTRKLPIRTCSRRDTNSGNKNSVSGLDGGETVDKNKGKVDANQLHITNLIKPVHYLAIVTNDVHEVSLTFNALRSDGQEVLVDNKELKATNPLLLINFYEQHLRYNPVL